MKLADFGYNDKLEKYRIDTKLEKFELGRVISEHKERYIVKTQKGDLEAEITGNLRFSAQSREGCSVSSKKRSVSNNSFFLISFLRFFLRV